MGDFETARARREPGGAPFHSSVSSLALAISIKAEMPSSPPSCPRQPSPSGDTLKLATLPSRFATETTHRHTRLYAAPFSFHWPPIGYSFVARRSRCGGASFQPSVLGKVSRHETFTKSHENSTGSEPCCFFVIFRVGFVSHRLAETRRVK